MTASCLKDYQGLIGGHAYTILGVQELLAKDRQISEQLIKLRNPIGLEEYTGPWNNDDDTRWTQSYRKQAKLNKVDNSFFMEVEEFKKAFSNYDITYYHNHWKQKAYKQTGPGKKWAYPFTLLRN